MRYARENVMSPEELAREFEMSESRLADLRSQRKGPPYFKFGGIWYPRDGFDEWVQEQMVKGDDDVAEKEGRQVALPVQVQRPRALGQHRFGRHTNLSRPCLRPRLPPEISLPGKVPGAPLIQLSTDWSHIFNVRLGLPVDSQSANTPQSGPPGTRVASRPIGGVHCGQESREVALLTALTELLHSVSADCRLSSDAVNGLCPGRRACAPPGRRRSPNDSKRDEHRETPALQSEPNSPRGYHSNPVIIGRESIGTSQAVQRGPGHDWHFGILRAIDGGLE